ncbi:transmembrane GTPase fzo1 [Coprinellus micaceus]|uniref:Transmembrane GTPase fzo1 n=1 Tax=Coprinellus micaceus TaxID=71717 RepID=A0A4Y7SLY6_COPMI|nr:transmembrane GTPase fzo1 [Coprinellus micaceus]
MESTSTATSPTLSNFSDGGAEHLNLKGEDVQEIFIENKDRLVNAIDATKSILNAIRNFNKDDWVVRYPQLKDSEPEPAAETGEAASESVPSLSTPPRRKSQRRSLSFADDPTFETEVIVEGPRISLSRSTSLPVIHDGVESECMPSCDDAAAEKEADSVRLIPSSDFNVLRLDLKLGAHSSSSSAASLVSQLEKASIANLLDDRIGSSLSHIEKLRLRVEDTSSKVLVTGDLNAGKSTFVNALLRREVMPVDQQPCTTAFCEVHDAAENNGVEEAHILKEGATYDIADDSTFARASLEALEDIVGDNEHKAPHEQSMVKLYLADTRAPSESLLNNGVVDISLIDAPGLNRDSLKTTAVFARQEEIDVVVFVVSAENHFTLSAREFLQNASNEKAYLFIVVNKFAGIKHKERCRRAVLDQIRQLSPGTYDDAEDLVHFVDSAAALQPYTANPAFDDLESALRSFVLVKRSKSKLQPVSTYLSNLLGDIELLARTNIIVADVELERAQEDLSAKRPVLDQLKKSKDVLENEIEQVEEDNTTKASETTKSMLSKAIERVGQGKLGVDVPTISMPAYPGLLGIWDYARDVRRAMLASIDDAVRMAEDQARGITKGGVDKIKDLGELHLPADAEKNTRVFMPEAMFRATRKGHRGTKSRRSSTSYSNIGGAIVAGGLHGLGIGLAQRHDLLETTFFDLFDVNHQWFVHFGDAKSVSDDTDAMAPSALSVVSVGLGALTMVGGQALGARAMLEGIVRVSDLLSNETARKWAAPVVGAFALGATAYLILELPSSIPRTVGRRVKASIVKGDGSEVPVSFVDAHATRVGKETRKVLRLAGWDLRGRFTKSMDDSTKEVKTAEEAESKAKKAGEWFGEIAEKAVGVKETVVLAA